MSIRRVFEGMSIALVLALAIASGCSKGSSGGAQEAPTATPPTSGEPATPVATADAGTPSEVPAADAGTPSEVEVPGGDVGPLSDCDTSKVRCRRIPPQCAEGEAASVEGSCFGPCVKIERCACSETVKCPNANKHTCWSNKHCGPYVR